MCCWRGSLHARQASARSSLVEPRHMKGSERLGCIILAFVAPFRHYFPCQRRSSPGKWPVFGGRRSGTVGRSGEEPHGNLGKQGRVTEGSAHTSTHSPPSCRHPVCYSASSANKKMTLITFEDHKCSSSNNPQTRCSCSRKKKRARATSARATSAKGSGAERRSRWDARPDARHGISQSLRAVDSGDDLRPCNLSIISQQQGLFPPLLTVPPQLKLHDE